MLSRFLIIEDDEYEAELLARVYAPFAEPVVARTAHEAEGRVCLLSELALLSVDAGLPDGSGLTIAKRFRAAGFRGPIFVISGRIDDETLRAGWDLHAQVMPKPIELEQLRSAMVSVSFLLDPDHHPVAEVCVKMELTRRESELVLARANGASRAELLAMLPSKAALKFHSQKVRERTGRTLEELALDLRGA